MKRFMLALPLLLLLIPTSGQPGPLGVSEGDTFTFVLDKWDVDFEDGETAITFEDDANTASVTIEVGDSFTVEILDATPVKDEWGDYQILVKYTANGASVETHEWVDFGGFIAFTNWDEYRSEFESELSDDTGYSYEDYSYSTSGDIIDTSDEFGYKVTSTYSYSGTDGTEKEESTQEIRYKKSDGVLNYLHYSFKESSTDASGSVDSGTGEITVHREGYNLPDTDGGVSLPGFQFIWVASLFLIPIIRKFKQY